MRQFWNKLVLTITVFFMGASVYAQADSPSTLKGDDMTSTVINQSDNEFLTQISSEEGVVTTDSGLRYKVLSTGKGAVPTKTSTVSVNYEGRLVDGSVFDSSYQRGVPARFGVSDVIAGWTEALQLMNAGSTWELYIPADLAYGQRGVPGVIPPNAVLVFKVELLEVS